MKCPSCRFDNVEGMKFCVECGTRLELRCADCGAEYQSSFKFCGECGRRLHEPEPGAPPPEIGEPRRAEPAEPSDLPEAEAAAAAEPPEAPGSGLRMEAARKRVTVLAGEARLWAGGAEHGDAEALHARLSGFFSRVHEAVSRYGGVIHHFSDRGFRALFGAPVAMEDHADRAVLTALELREMEVAVGGAGEELRAAGSVDSCLALASGAVVVGGVGATLVGDVSERADRLLAAGGVGSILADAATRDLTLGAYRYATFEAEPEAPSGFEVVGPAEEEADPGSVLPFVGRKRELEILDEIATRCSEGEGQVVGIVGEAGAGKSRLVRELRRRWLRRGPVYLRGHCSSYGLGIPYQPLIAMVRRASGVLEADPPDQVSAKLRRSLLQVGCDPEQDLVYFLKLLGLPVEPGALSALGPLGWQHRTFDAMQRMVTRAARRSLVVLELEDLHWIDETSEAFLEYLVETIGSLPVLVLVTFRTGYRPSWITRSYATQIALRRLSEAESETLLRAAAGGDAVPDPVAREILAKADGNPLFIEELSRSVGAEAELAVPDTIQDLLLARLDQLPPQHRKLLQVASVLGRDFAGQLLARLAEEEGEVEVQLKELRAREFLVERGTEGGPAWAFKHALIREVAYQSLLTADRKALHLRAGEVLEDLHPDRLEEVSDLLMYHFSKAGSAPKAVEYFLLFADRAARRNAHVEAVGALREALTAAADLPASGRSERRVAICLRLAEYFLPLARFVETLELLDGYREDLEALGEEAPEGRWSFWRAHTLSYLGRPKEAAEAAQHAVTVAQPQKDDATEGKAWYVLGRDAFWAGRFAEGREDSQRAVVLLERSGEVWWQGQAHWVNGFHHLMLGHEEEALAEMERARGIGEALEDYRLDASWSIGFLHAAQGDWERGVEECLGGLKRARDPLNSAAARGFLGYAYLVQPDLPRAIEALEQSVTELEKAGMLQLLGWFSSYLAEAYQQAGRLDEAQEQGRLALDHSESGEFRYGVALAHRTLACISRTTGQSAAADEAFAQALSGFQDLGIDREVERTRSAMDAASC